MSDSQLANQAPSHTRCTLCKIKSYAFFYFFHEDELKVFVDISKEKNYKNNQSIFLQQDISSDLFNITEGNVKIYQLLNDGRIQIIGFLYPGDFFGSYKNGKYNYSADAIGEVRACVFAQEKLDKYIEKNIPLAKELLHLTSHELTLAQDRMSVLGKFGATERLGKFIFNVSEQRKRIGWKNNPISLPMTRQDIADYLGLTIETVSREFSKLKTSNIIKILSAKQIFISDFEKLVNITT
jgi:CRP/FNR family transcriptional regulator